MLMPYGAGSNHRAPTQKTYKQDGNHQAGISSLPLFCFSFKRPILATIAVAKKMTFSTVMKKKTGRKNGTSGRFAGQIAEDTDERDRKEVISPNRETQSYHSDGLNDSRPDPFHSRDVSTLRPQISIKWRRSCKSANLTDAIKKAPRSRAPSPFTAHAIGGELALLYEDTQQEHYHEKQPNANPATEPPRTDYSIRSEHTQAPLPNPSGLPSPLASTKPGAGWDRSKDSRTYIQRDI